MTPIQRRALLATIIGSGVVFLDGSIVNLALPRLAAELHAGFTGQQWVIDGYLLTLSALILLGGSLGDIYGRKKVYFWGAAGFGAMSLLCAAAPTIGVLVGARFAQGVFGALMVPGALAIIDTTFSDGLRGKAIGQWTAATSGIIAVGPLLGGWLMDVGSWRLLFMINAPLLLLTFWLGLSAIRETKDRVSRTVDVGGAVLVGLALIGLTHGLIEGPTNHWAPLALWSLVLGVVCFGLFLRYESRCKDPMLPLKLFASPNFTGANVATFAMYGGLGGFFFALIIYVQNTLHYSGVQAGLIGLPVSICLMLLSGRVGGLSGRHGPRLFMTLGPIVAGIGILTLLPLHAGSTYVTGILPGVMLFGLGMSLTVAPLTTTVLATVHRTDAGIASAVNNAVSRVSGLIVIAVLGILGTAHVFQFAVALCGSLAIGAGLLSFILVRNVGFNEKR